MERFTDQVNIQPVSTRSGQPQAIMSLVERLEQFKNVMYQGAARHAARVGAEKAGKVVLEKDEKGVTKSPEFKKNSFIGGIERGAYNEALKTAYLASIDADNRVNLGKLAAENPDDILTFNEKAEKYRNGVVSSTDPFVKRTVEQDLNHQISILQTKIQANNIKKNYEIAKQETLNDVSTASDEALRASRNNDLEIMDLSLRKVHAFLIAGVGSGFWSIEDVKNQEKELRTGLEAQKYLGKIDEIADVSIDQANDYLGSIENDVPKEFTPDQWRAVVVEGQQNINRKAARLRKASKAAAEREMYDASISRGLSFLVGTGVADPKKGGQDREDINNAFENVVVPTISTWPQDQQYKAIMNTFKNTNMIPEKIMSNIRAVMRDGDTAQIISASRFIEGLAKNPKSIGALRDLTPESRNIAKQVNSSIESGIDPVVAVEMAKQNVYKLSDSEKETIKLKINNLKSESPDFLADYLESFAADNWDPNAFIGFFGAFEEPEIPEGLQADFNLNFEKHMMFNGGDVKQALELAAQDTRRFWAPTKIGGDWRMMKYAPEAMAMDTRAENQDWMYPQFEQDMIQKGFDPDNVFIGVTEKTLSANPEWSLMVIEDGQMVAKGTWYPDFTETMEYQENKTKTPTEEALKDREKIKGLIKYDINAILIPDPGTM